MISILMRHAYMGDLKATQSVDDSVRLSFTNIPALRSDSAEVQADLEPHC